MGFPLYDLPTDPELQKYIKPSQTAGDGGYSYQRPLRDLPLMAKVIGVIMFFTVFPPMLAVYALIWYFLIR